MIKVTEIIKPIAFDYFYTVRRHCMTATFVFLILHFNAEVFQYLINVYTNRH